MLSAPLITPVVVKPLESFSMSLPDVTVVGV